MKHLIPVFLAEAEERKEQVNVEKLYDLLREQSEHSTSLVAFFLTRLAGDRLRHLEDDNRRLSDNLQSCLEDVSSVRNSMVSQRPQVRFLSHLTSSASLMHR